RAAMGPRMTGGSCRSVSPSALVQRLLSIGGRELNFKLMNLIPLGVSSPALRYREKLLQASAGGHRLWFGHGGIIPSFDSAVPPARGELAAVMLGEARALTDGPVPTLDRVFADHPATTFGPNSVWVVNRPANSAVLITDLARRLLTWENV